MKQSKKIFEIDENIQKHLMIELIYPAVFGGILFEFIVSPILKSKTEEFLFDSIDKVLMKILLICGVLWFYSCDFLYSVFTKEFKKRFFFYDLIILTGLTYTAKSINTDSTLIPNINMINGMFVGFMIIYFVWDFVESRDQKNEKLNLEKDFYKGMVAWELQFFGVFLALLLINVYWNNHVYAISWLTAASIMITNFFFTRLIRKKRDFANRNL